MKVRLIVVALAIVTTSLLHAVNYIRPGLKYEFRGQEAGTISKNYDIIEGDTVIGGVDAFKLYRVVGDEKKVLLSVLHTEGDKVFYLKAPGSTEWELLYDFGMKPGEIVEYTEPSMDVDTWFYHIGKKTAPVECTEVSFSPLYNADLMKMSWIRYKDEESSEESWRDYGEWLYGIGSVESIMGNLLGFYNHNGGISNVARVTLNGEVLVDFYSGVEDIEDVKDTFRVTSLNSTLIIENVTPSDNICITDISGYVIYSGKTEQDVLTIPVSGKGIYIVRIGDRAVKTICR